jgi:hypothetical protein
MIQAEIIQKIKTLLEAVPEIGQVIAHPLDDGEKIEQYPAVIFYRDSGDNQFADTGANHRTFNFKVHLLIEANELSREELFESVLPNASDAVLEKIDIGWDFGTFDGHRAWARMSTTNAGLSIEDKSKIGWETFNLIVRLDVNI